MKAIPLSQHHFPELFKVCRDVEPWWEHNEITFNGVMAQREGFTIVNGDSEIVGSVNFGNFQPNIDICVHSFIAERYQSRWLTKKIYKAVFDYVFEYLELTRCSSYIIKGMIENETILSRLGFKSEGIQRQYLPIKGKRYDVEMYGMLKEERRW